MCSRKLEPLGVPWRQIGDGHKLVVSDEELLAGVRSGDHAALRALYRRHAPVLVARLSLGSGDGSLIEEALQDTFVAVWQSADAYRGDGEVGAWLWGIARNQFASQLRAASRRPPVIDSSDFAAADRSDGLIELLAVSEAASGLPSHMQETLRALVVDGLSIGEAADKLGVSAGTIKSRLHRLRRRLGNIS